jgi:hypothetical protein
MFPFAREQGAPVRSIDHVAGGLGSTLHVVLARPDVGVGVNLAAAASLIAFGIVGIGRSSAPFWDMHVLYAAGRMWAAGHNPYMLADFIRDSDAIDGLAHPHVHMGFAYPPTIAPLCLALGALSLAAANALIVAVNVVATGITAFYSMRLVCAGLPPGRLQDSLRWTVPALVVGNPFATHIMNMGQTTSIAAAALVAGWYYSEVRSRQILSGALFAVAAIKPQVAVLCILWIVAKGRWRQLAALGTCAVLLAAVPLYKGGAITVVRTWLTAMRYYELGPGLIQRVGFQNVFGVQSTLVACGLAAPSLALVAALFLALLLWYRRRLAQDEVVSLLLAATCLFVYVHDYDLAVLAPLFGLVWKRSAASNVFAAIAAGTFALLFGPQRFLRASHVAILLHWRELVLLCVLIALLVDSTRGWRRQPRSWAQ